MGLLDVLNGMQNGPRGPSTSSAQSGGGMSPMTMAILGLLAYKAVKHLTASAPGASPAPSPATAGGGMGDPGGLLKGGLGGLMAGGAAGSVIRAPPPIRGSARARTRRYRPAISPARSVPIRSTA
jgi:hypothetical protein